MKSRLLIILSIILSTTWFLNGQTADLNSKLEKIGRYREEINGHLLSGNIDRIEVKRYFDLDSADLAYLAFDEEELLLLITGDHKLLLNDLLIRNTKFYKGKNLRDIEKNDDRASAAYRYTQHYFDSLTGNIIKYFSGNHYRIENDIRSGNLENHEIDFLSLIIDYYLAVTDFCNKVPPSFAYPPLMNGSQVSLM